MKETSNYKATVQKIPNPDRQIQKLNEISLLNLQIQMLEEHLNTAHALKQRLEGEF